MGGNTMADPELLAEQIYDLAEECRVQAEGLRFHLGRGHAQLASGHADNVRLRANALLELLQALGSGEALAAGTRASLRPRASTEGCPRAEHGAVQEPADAR